jgi:pimeloyl-ACP methyl ester carboxylesterase
MMGSVRSDGCDLYYEEVGGGVPILLVHPAGATAATWGSATEELARIGRVLTYDRRGYARPGGHPARSISTHTADAAAMLESLAAPHAVVVGTSAGAAIAVALAVRRPDLVQVVIAHEFPWRFTRHLPTASQVAALARIGSLALGADRGRPPRRYCARPTATVTVVAPGMPFPRRGGGRPGTTRGRPWWTFATRSAAIPPRRSLGPSRSRGVQLRRAEPHQHGRFGPVAGRCHPHGANPANRRGRPCPRLRCPRQLRAADRRHHHPLETVTFWVHARMCLNGSLRGEPGQPP